MASAVGLFLLTLGSSLIDAGASMDTIAFWAQWITLGLIIGLPILLTGRLPNAWTIIGCWAYIASYCFANLWHVAFWTVEQPHAYGFALRLYTVGMMLGLLMYCAVVFAALTLERLPRPDLQAKLVWLILLMAEAFQVLEYVQCKMLTDPFGEGDLVLSQIWGVEVSRYACGRALGTLSPWIAPIITTAWLLWILMARRNDARISRS